MCTLVLLYRPNSDWPLILGANRDEMATRSWLPPDRHWPDQKQIIAGLDQVAQGTWLGINDAGVVAAISNRQGSLGVDAVKRSRGELVLEALAHNSAADAAEALVELEPQSYRSFNLVIADQDDAFWMRNVGATDTAFVDSFKIPEGISMLTYANLNDMSCPRIRGYLPRFRKIAVPDPDKCDWSSWEPLFLSRTYNISDGPKGAMLVRTESGFNTLCSSFIALPSSANSGSIVWRFARTYPKTESYQNIYPS